MARCRAAASRTCFPLPCQVRSEYTETDTETTATHCVSERTRGQNLIHKPDFARISLRPRQNKARLETRRRAKKSFDVATSPGNIYAAALVALSASLVVLSLTATEARWLAPCSLSSPVHSLTTHSFSEGVAERHVFHCTRSSRS